MGFYGKIYEQAVDIFNRLRFKNANGESSFPSTPLAEDVILRADGGEACATLEAGNKWIQFARNGDLNCKIYHCPSTQEAGEKQIFISTPHDGVDTSIEGIDFGAILTIQYPITDNAGHIIGYTEKKYQLQSDISALQQELESQGTELTNLQESITTTVGELKEADANLALEIQNSIESIEKSAAEAEYAAEQAKSQADKATKSAEQAKSSSIEAAAQAQEAVEKVTQLQDDICSVFVIFDTSFFYYIHTGIFDMTAKNQ